MCLKSEEMFKNLFHRLDLVFEQEYNETVITLYHEEGCRQSFHVRRDRGLQL